MLYIITIPPSKSSVATYRVLYDAAEALLVACGFIRSGFKGVAISNGGGKRIEGHVLTKACESGELTL
jgi:hypothetical protein